MNRERWFETLERPLRSRAARKFRANKSDKFLGSPPLEDHETSEISMKQKKKKKGKKRKEKKRKQSREACKMASDYRARIIYDVTFLIFHFVRSCNSHGPSIRSTNEPS